MKLLISYLFLFFSLPAFCQSGDTLSGQLQLSATGSLNRTDNSSAYLLNHLVSLGVNKGRSGLHLDASWLYGGTAEKRTNNDVSLNSNINLFRTGSELYFWGLLNYTSSYSLNIKSQGQLGIGLAYNLLNKKHIWLNISDGILGESSRIIQTDSTVLGYQTLRNSFRIQFQYRFADRAQIMTSGYFQPSLSRISDHILSGNASLSYAIWKGLRMESRLSFNKISRTGKQNLIFTYGLNYLHAF